MAYKDDVIAAIVKIAQKNASDFMTGFRKVFPDETVTVEMVMKEFRLKRLELSVEWFPFEQQNFEFIRRKEEEFRHFLAEFVAKLPKGSLLLAYECPNSHNYGIGKLIFKIDGTPGTEMRGRREDSSMGNLIYPQSVIPLLGKFEEAAIVMESVLPYDEVRLYLDVKSSPSMNEMF